MKVCYRYKCDKTLTANENESDEHVIQNFLGGRLQSKKLLCRKCNSFFGATLDDALRKNSILPTILNLKIQRGKVKKKIKGIDSESNTHYELYNSKEKVMPLNKKEIDENGNEICYFQTKKQAQKYFDKFKRRNPNIDIDRFKISQTKNDKAKVYYDDCLTRYDIDYKAICKIAINYYLSLNNDINWINEIIEYIEPDSEIDNKFIRERQKPLGEIYDVSETEISHVLYLKGNKELGVLYCFIELFNVYGYLIILKNPYYGPAIESCYSHDLINLNELKKDPRLEVSSPSVFQLLSLQKPRVNLHEVYKTKMERVLKLSRFEDSIIEIREKNKG